MQSMVNTTQKADNKLHEVFEPSFDWKHTWRHTGNAEHRIRTTEIKLHTLESMQRRNKIVELPEQYIHSSAKFYITGEQGIYPVTGYTELEDIDLTKWPRMRDRKVLP
jgi:hypothetical protein